jgi:hypothetical protein
VKQALEIVYSTLRALLMFEIHNIPTVIGCSADQETEIVNSAEQAAEIVYSAEEVLRINS